MTVESATYIDDLNSSYPATNDEKQEGDDHIRLIKAVLLATFPNIAGAVSPTHTELNYVDGVTSSIQDQIDALVGGMSSIDSGTVMLFVQTAAPTGWTKSTTHNDKTLRIVSGTASNGGSVAFSTLFGRTATDAHTLTTTQIPAHTHTGPSHTHTVTGTAASDGVHSHSLAWGAALGYSAGGGGSAALATGSTVNTTSIANSAAHTHSVTGTAAAAGTGNTGSAGSSGSHTHNVDMRVQYVDAILAVKD